MRKKISLLLAATLCLSLCACGNNEKPNTDEPKQQISQTENNTTDTSKEPEQTIDLSIYQEVGETYGPFTSVKKGESWMFVNNKTGQEYHYYHEIVDVREKIVTTKYTDGDSIVYNFYNIEKEEEYLSDENHEFIFMDNGVLVNSTSMVSNIGDISNEMYINYNTGERIQSDVGLAYIKNSNFIGVGEIIDGKNKYKLFDTITNSYVSDNVFDYFGEFHDGLIATINNGSWGYIDESTNVVIDFMYEEVGEMINGVVPVKYGDNWGLINTKGEFLVKPMYSNFIGFLGENNNYVSFEETEINKLYGAYLYKIDGTLLLAEDEYDKEAAESFGYVYRKYIVDETRDLIYAIYGYRTGQDSNEIHIYRTNKELLFAEKYWGFCGNPKLWEIKQEWFDFKGGPILLSPYKISTLDTNSNPYKVSSSKYLLEDGTISEEYSYAGPFRANQKYAIVKKIESKKTLGAYLIDRNMNVVKEIDKNLDYRLLTNSYAIYADDGLLVIRNIDTNEDLIKDIKSWDYIPVSNGDVIIFEDKDTNLLGMFYEGKVIKDAIYSDIQVDTQNSTIKLFKGSVEEVISFTDIVKE